MLNRSLLLIVIALALASAGGCSTETPPATNYGNRPAAKNGNLPAADHGVLPTAVEDALRDGENFELLSLDPMWPQNDLPPDYFHGWNVLGRTAIEDSETRAELFSAFKKGVVENDESPNDCFDPRHGIQVTHEGSTHTFVICFACLQVEWHIDGEYAEGFLISGSPKPVFDDVLEKADIPLAD